MKPTILLLLGFAHSALAQEEVAPPSAVDGLESVRLRGGITAGIGTFAPGPNLMVGISGRLGCQLTRTLGLEGEFALAAGVGVNAGINANGASASVSGAGYSQFALLVDFIAFDHLFVDLGPAMAHGGWAGAIATANRETGSGTAQAYGVAGWLPGAAAKIGYLAGGSNPATGQRRGFVISLDVNVLFGDRIAAVATASRNGGTSARANFGTGVGLGAMLNLGYAWE